MRLQTDMPELLLRLLLISALSDSRVLIGQSDSTYLELLRVEVAVDAESGARIAPVRLLHVTEQYIHFCASTCGSDTLVAMSLGRTSRCGCRDCATTGASRNSRAHNWSGHGRLLWRADRLLVTEWNAATKSHSVSEFEVSGSRIERRRQLIAADERIDVRSWCAVDDGLAIVDGKSGDLLHYALV